MGPTLKVFCNYCIVDFHVRDRPFTLGPQEHSYDGDLGLLLYYLDTTKLLFSPYFRYGLEHSSSRLHQACRREIIFVLSRMINEFLIQLSSGQKSPSKHCFRPSGLQNHKLSHQYSMYIVLLQSRRDTLVNFCSQDLVFVEQVRA